MSDRVYQLKIKVNCEFQVKFGLKSQGQLTPKTIGILTKVFCTPGSKFGDSSLNGWQVITWTRSGLTHGPTDTRTHRQPYTATTILTKIPEGQYWSVVLKTWWSFLSLYPRSFSTDRMSPYRQFERLPIQQNNKRWHQMLCLLDLANRWVGHNHWIWCPCSCEWVQCHILLHRCSQTVHVE